MRLSGGNFVRSIWGKRRRVFWTVALCTLVLFSLAFCYHWFLGPRTRPPDLSSCTRFEIGYPRSTLNYFLPDTALQRSILSLDEKEYIESIKFLTIDDPERIKAFAHDMGLGSYEGRARVTSPHASPVGIRCYNDKGHMISFTVLENVIVTEDWRHFTYPIGLPNLETIEPAEMQPFKLRFECGLNMQRIYTSGPLYYRKVNVYPDPSGWCDAVMRERTNASFVSEEKMSGDFRCPAANEGKCNYAINPNCTLDSPPDMVLLFETKAGWNQHGGPELFTFDNHDPKGGCVLLNDGTVKFIRTKEELQQLRWR